MSGFLERPPLRVGALAQIGSAEPFRGTFDACGVSAEMVKCLLVLSALLATAAVRAQVSASFEVVSVKPNHSGDFRRGIGRTETRAGPDSDEGRSHRPGGVADAGLTGLLARAATT